MKNFNLIEMLQGCSKRNGTAVYASNPDGQPTVNRQSRVMSQSGCSAVDVPMTSYGASDEHPMSIRSASDGERWKPAGEKGSTRVWKHVAMIFAVLVMSIGQVWADTELSFSPTAKTVTSGSVSVRSTNTTPSSLNPNKTNGWKVDSNPLRISSTSANITKIVFTGVTNSSGSGFESGGQVQVSADSTSFAKLTSGFSFKDVLNSSLKSTDGIYMNKYGSDSYSVTLEFSSPQRYIHICKASSNGKQLNIFSITVYTSAAASGKNIYLKPNGIWDKDGARFAAYYWKSSGSGNGWVDFASYNACTPCFKATIPSGYDKVILCRMNGATAENNWNNKWNQTLDQTVPTGNDTCFTISSINGCTESKSCGSWGTYTAPTYTISFAANGGSSSMSNISSIACGSDQKITANGYGAPSGYQFAGWKANVAVTIDDETVSAGTIIADQATLQNISSDITLTAQWELIPTYDVIYNTNGGTGGSTATQSGNADGSQVTTSANGFTRSGYKFKWWNTAANGSGEDFYPGEKVTIDGADVNLYAQWEEVPTDWAYWVGDVAFSDNKADVTGNGVTMRLTNNGGAWNTDVSQDKNRVSRYNNTTDKHAKVLAVDANNKYLQVHFTDGSPINTLSLGVVNTDASTANGMIVIYSTTADFSSGSGEKVEHNSPGYRQATKSMTDFSPSVSNTYYYARIYRDVNTAVYGFTGGSEKTIRIYAVKAEKGQVCNAPSALAAASTTAKGTTFTVTDGDNTNNYDFYVSTSSSAPNAETSATHTVSGGKTKTITDCVAGTTYYAWVRSVCGVSNKSGWTALTGNTFTTSTVTVTHTLTNVSKTSGEESAGGSDYMAVYTADAEYSMPTPTVTIDGNTATSGTDYTWSVEGAVGTITIPANKINGNIVITLNSSAAAPSSVAITGDWLYFAGETIELTATPTGGNGPVTYQWYKGGKENGNAIEGATSATYTKASCAFEDAGSYYCKVTCGGTQSTWGQSGNAYDVKIPRLYVKTGHYYDLVKTDYGNVDFTRATASTATASITLGSNWDYCFNIADGCGHYYGNSGTMQYNNYGPWVTNVNPQDCGLRTTNGATYVFTINYSNWSQLTTTVTFPSSDQAADKIIYFDNQTVDWSTLHYRIGRADHTQATPMTKVPGTNNLYTVTTAAYSNAAGWHIANNAGWTGSNSIYRTYTKGDGYSITYATAHEGGAVTESAVTVTPTTSRGAGADAGVNDNCTFYNYEITTGMKTQNVAISPYSNGTITVNYTNTSDVASTLTSGNADLAHSVILTSITATPNTGYSASAITINGGAYSANYVVTGATTIAASFTPQTYSITYKDQGGADFSGEHADGYPTTHTYGSSTVLKGATKAGYTFGGWFGNPECTGAAMNSIGATSITAGIILYAKWTPAATLYTVTFNSNGGSAVSPITQASVDASITMPAAPTYSGHTFQGWVIGGTTYAAGASYTPTADITAYASWKADCAGGGGGSGTTLFSQDFNSATAVAYAAATARTYTTSSTLEGLVGSGANLFTLMKMIQKNDCGIGTNSTTGGNSRNYTGKFGAYCNNTQSGGLWSICRTSDFAVSAPTAIKVEFKLLVNYLAGGTPIEFAIGNGFSDDISAPAYNKIYTGFGINAGSASAIKACKFGGTTALTSNTITNNTELQYTWIINATGSDLEYDDPAGGKQTLSTGTFDLWIGTTLYLDGQSRTAAGNTAFSGTTMQEIYIGDPQGKKCDITLDDFVVTDLTPAGGGCYYVTYDGNGAEAGSISDATAYAASDEVTVSSNTGTSAFTKSGYHVGSWNTAPNGSGTTYALGATFNISADVTLYAQWVADACSAPAAPTISGTSVRTVGQTITLNAACATGADASTTYTWYKGDTWETKSQVQAALTAGEGGRIFNKASCVAGDAGTYWCEASNGTGCESHNATGFAVAVNAAGEEHIYYYKDADHYDSETDTYYNPEGNTATLKDNQNLSSPWTICNGCMTGVDSVVAHNATYDGKGNHMNAYIKIPTEGTATTKNIKFCLHTGYTGTLTVKIGGYSSNPTVSLYKLASVNGAIDGDPIPYTGTVSGVATTENNFNAITWPLSTAGGTYVLTVTSKTGYISQIDMTTSTSATFNVTYNGNGNTGGSEPTDATNYASGATVTAAANSGSLVKTNYTGAGWNTANNGTGTNYVPGSGTFTITANTTLYAHWTQLITLAPGAQGTGTSNAAVSWNGSVLRGFTAHTASGYALQGYYTEPSGGTKVLNADGSFAATDIDGFVTSGKWSNTGAAPTLYAQWEASNLLKWNLKVNVKETSITTLSKESAAPTVIAVANMNNLTNNGSLTITGSAKSALTSKIEAPTSYDADKYMSVQFVVAAGYQLRPSDINVKVQPVDGSCSAKLVLEDNSVSMEKEQTGISKGNTVTVTMTNTSDKTFTGTVTLKIYVYGASTGTYRLGTPIEINGSVEETCTPPTFDGISYSATEYTVGASASAISVTGAANVDSYQWKYNIVNDRTSGTNCGTGASVTPSTESTGTLYYWCELTNTCTTVKTAAVGITVRNATTDPTVTWSNVKLGATDDVTPNYGGGNYVLRATVNETSWPGTLAASMITAPAGITIHHVTTGTDASREYIEFQFDVTTAFDRASNATIDFNLALPEAGSYSALNSVKSVTYNDCSSGAAGQVAIKMGATASTSKSNPQNYWETAGAGRLMYNYGSNMGSTNNSSGYRTADSTFYYYAASTGQKWMFQTYIGGVNKVRVVFRAAGTIKSSKATITDFYYNTEYFASPGSNAVSFGDVNANKAGYSSGEDGYIEFTVPEMAANSYGAFVTGDGNMKVYGVVLYSENAGTGGSVETAPVWSDSKADGFEVNKTQSDANFGYTISTTTNTLGAITYSSSNPSVAAVNATTGEVTITATGASAQSAVITATLARSGCYKGATRTYTINVAGYSCSEPSGSVELTTGSATKCASENVTLTLTGFTEGADIQWYNGDSPISNGGGYTITTTATQSTLTTKAAGTYSAIATSSCAAKRTNSITIANMDMSEQKTVRKVSQWYVKNGRPTPDIALWQLGEGERFKSVAWSTSSNGTGLDFRTDTETGIVYLEGKEPNANETGNDIEYTLTLTVTDACGTDHALSGQTIKLTHQKNTDKHVLAFVVNGTAKGGFTEGITAAQTTSVDLYNAIAAQFDVQATNIYSTDDEQKLREYYSQYDILCITDYPNTQTKGANSKSYVDAIGALIDIRPILTMEAYVSSLSNWKLKGVSGNPKSPTTRQYTMDLQCKDHEIFNGVTTTKIGEGDEAMYRVTMVDKSQEEYKTLDANYGDGEHKANEGYQYGKKPALQGFTYTEEMSDNDLLPLGLIDDGAGNKLQVGIERQAVMEARMMVLGINSYAMERLAPDGETIVINALKYLMKKNAEDISDCSVYFDGSDETDPTNWDNELNWGPSYASLPLPHQEVRILKECVVKDGVVARASGIKIIPSGPINHNTDVASGSLTIEPGGALIVDGKVRAATAPNYFNAYPTTPSDLAVLANSDGNGTLIFDNGEGETKATIQMYSKAITDVAHDYAGLTWQYVAVPYSDNNNAHHNYYNSWLYAWAADNRGWEVVPNGGNVYPWIGYCITQDAATTYTMDGTLVETSQQEFTVPAGVPAAPVEKVIGNSWTAPLQVTQFTDDDFGALMKNIYLFNTGLDSTCTGGDAETRYQAGTYVTIPIHSASYTGDSLVSSLQAFFVRNESGSEATLTLDYDRHVRPSRSTDIVNAGPMHAPSRFIASDEPTVLKIWASGSRYDDRLILLEREDFSTGYDAGWDGDKWKEGDASPRIYTIMESGEEAITATPELEGTIIGFRAGEDNSYTLRFEYNESDDPLYILDTENRIYTRVLTDQTYQFTTNDKAAHSRFVLTRTDGFATPTGIDDVQGDKVHEAKAKKFIMDDKMYILFNGRVFDATGKAVK